MITTSVRSGLSRSKKKRSSDGRAERGQGLAEYCLMTALLAIVALAIAWHASGGLDGSWGAAKSNLTAANSVTGPDQHMAPR